jgi:hypothetical protein
VVISSFYTFDLQPLLHVTGLHWGVTALHEDDDAAAKKEKIVKAFAADPIAFLSGKVTHCRLGCFLCLIYCSQALSIEQGITETLKFEPARAKELCFTFQMQ